MVSALGNWPILSHGLALAEVAVGEKLPPPTRAAVFMALLGIALLGMLLVVIILLGGHWVRRQGSARRGPVVPPDRRPLSGPAASAIDIDGAGEPVGPESIPGGGAGETIVPQDTQSGKKKAP